MLAEASGTERTVDVAPADAADTVDARRVLFSAHALRGECVDDAANVLGVMLGVTAQKAPPLLLGEDARLEAGMGDPFSPRAYLLGGGGKCSARNSDAGVPVRHSAGVPCVPWRQCRILRKAEWEYLAATFSASSRIGITQRMWRRAL